MTALLLDHIGELVTNDHPGRGPAGQAGEGALALRRDAAVVVADGLVAWVGPSRAAPAADHMLDCRGGAVIPGFVDSHTHPVFAGDRAAEFAARMAGLPYAAGGIRTTVAATRAATTGELRANLQRLAAEMQRGGTTTFEAKSGYGLTAADEARAVALARELTSEVTFLGAHVVPAEYPTQAYLGEVTGPMLAACAPQCRWIDVFCEDGAFDAAATREVLLAGRAAGLGLRVHGNQLRPGPGVGIAVAMGAASVDHCTHLRAADVADLSAAAPTWWATGAPPTAPDPTGGTVATLLPGAEFSTRSQYPDARQLQAAGAVISLATDCNPGTSYTTSMPLCIALAVREMGMDPASALWSATAGGALALRRGDIGRIAPGCAGDLVVLAAPSYLHLAYRPGVDLVRAVIRRGRIHRGMAGHQHAPEGVEHA